jgi:serralysin
MATENDKRFCVAMNPDTLTPEDKAALAGRKAALLKSGRWPAGSVIKVGFLEGDASLQTRVRNFAKQWVGQGMANLTLSFVPSPAAAHIRIAFKQGDGSWSYLGTFCTTKPHPTPTMNFGWLTPASSDEEVRSVVLHEFGHALGLIHEHQNPTQPIKWNEPAVRKDLSGDPNFWDDATIKANVLDKYDPAAVITTPVDKTSIMMYPIPKAWTLDGFSAGLNTDLSVNDKAFIKKCYP